MVQLAGYGKLRRGSELPVKRPLVADASGSVKLEIEDQFEGERGPVVKRTKWGTGSMPPTEVIQNSLLNEPSPLGLRLRKSPSLLDLIQMRLSQATSSSNSSCTTNNESLDESKKKDTKSDGFLTINEKMKASNFPASLLRIGTWEYVSRYEGDLVAKCYFAKRKLVWEILDGGLKSKIEIQWSDITALKANSPEDGPGTLDIVFLQLARQPLFFRETNPQPRKHTLWQAASDFTEGQASIHRIHFLQCPQGVLSKHFEKLIQCDPRLCALSSEPEISLKSPFFEPKSSFLEDHEEYKCHQFDKLKDTYGSAIQESSSSCTSTSASVKNDIRDSVARLSDVSMGDIHAQDPVIKSGFLKGVNAVGSEVTNLQNSWDQLKASGLKPSMSVSDFVSQLEQCISEQITSGNPHLSGATAPAKVMLEELVQHLFSDSQVPASDENCVMTKVNSFCSLLQKDVGVVQSQQMKGASTSACAGVLHNDSLEHTSVQEDIGTKNATGMPRRDSFGELLMHLPRIASLRQFLFDIAEEDCNPSCPASNENSVMMKVNSFCSLLQKDGVVQSQQMKGASTSAGDSAMHNDSLDHTLAQEDTGTKNATGMSRRDSFGELLMHLPRIASLPQFLFDIAEEDCNPSSPSI
ncbi:uncharacterized protein LOC121969846 isoform X1 [Zingiber officinale]|uniref:uncharacterized protein LOC121969846 isoform X1 n=1 Tax=Zingiber officinale TaxID=94328 RepID=UPI001C4CC136|nr:uncharacterized protein LOC121969846 isoform X1 [Zingiber officinale]